MKNIVKAFLVILIATTSFLYSAEASVVSVNGKVEIKKGETWIPLATGDKVLKSAVISTGFKSSAVIKFNETLFTLAPLTRITLEQLAETPQKTSTQIFLDSGKVKSSVKKTANKRADYTVRGPVATASVRGTDFEASANGAISCSSGGVDAYPTQKELASPNILGEPSASESKDGDTTSFTAPQDISPSAPKNATVVTAGQAVVIKTDSSKSESALSIALKNSTVNVGGTQSLASREAMSTTAATSEVTANEIKASNGSINIHISISE